MGRDRSGVAGWRAAALLAGLLTIGAAAWRLAVPRLTAWSGPAAPPDATVAAVCAAALLAGVAWLGAVSCAVAVDAVRRPGRLPAVPTCPRVLELTVLALLGCGVAVTPAAADGPGAAPPPVAARLHGLAVPDRTVGATSTHRVAAPHATPGPHLEFARHLEVAPGDTLWSLAARRLPAHADVASIDRAWRALARANRDRIGPDPDLIFPGTVLRVPHPLAPGKDPS